MHLKINLKLVSLATIIMLGNLAMAKPAASWAMDEGKGQLLKNSSDSKQAGYLGSSQAKDVADPEWIKDGGRNVLYLNGRQSALFPDGEEFDFTKAKGFAIQLWFKPLTECNTGNNYRMQLLTKGADSNANCLQLQIIDDYRQKKNFLNFVFKHGKKVYYRVGAPTGDIVDKWNRITVVGNGKTLKLYLNGTLLAEKECKGLPRKSPYPVKMGVYAFGGKFGFCGYLKDLKIYKQAITPAPMKQFPAGKVLLENNFAVSKNTTGWKPLSGKWRWFKGAYCELSDKKTDKGAWLTGGNKAWNDYSVSATITFFDNQGETLIGCGWLDIDNHYQVSHEQHGSGMVTLNIAKVKNGRKTVLAALDNSAMPLPKKTRGKSLNYKIYFYQGIIAVMIDGRFYLAAADKTFEAGQVAFGAQARKIGIKKVTIRKLNSFTNPIKPVKISPVAIKMINSGLRHAFYRGEKIDLNLLVKNNTAKPVNNAIVKISVSNGIKQSQELKLGTLQPEKQFEKKISFQTSAWKSGAYKLTVKLAGSAYSGSYNIFIAPQAKPHGWQYASWGGGASEPFLKSLQDHGFTGSSIGASPKPDYNKEKAFFARALDNAVKHGQKLQISYNCLWSHPRGADTRMTRHDGSKGRAPNPQNPIQRKWALQGIAALTKMLDGHPAIASFLLNSENENIAEPDYSKAGRLRAKRELGFDMPTPANQAMEKDGAAGRVIQVPKEVKAKTPAVFPDDNKWYQFFRWFWQRGYGDNYLNEDMNKIIKQRFPKAKVTHDPYRDVPLFYRNKGLDLVGTWFYTHPDASETLGVSEVLVNATRDEKKAKGINFGASLWLYNGRICPAKNRYAGVQPTDIILESDWLAFSRIPDVIEHYSIAHFMPSARPQFQQKNTYSKLAQFSKEILQPLWPTVNRLKRAKRECAMLLSFGSQIFGQKIWSGYGVSSGFGYYAALQMAHIPTDIIFDENIQRNDLSKYKILFMHKTTHLPKSVFDKIVAFAKAGGTVICGAPFAKLIPGAIDFDMDMTKRGKSTYYHIITKKNGFTADVVYADMLKNAAAIRKLVRGKITPYADTDSPQAFLNVLEKNGAKYVFVVNDKRTFGDYVGKKYRAVMEQGLPQTVKVSLQTPNAAVYDLVTHRQLKALSRQGQTQVTLNLKPAWGAILAIYPQAISKVKLNVPRNLKAGQRSNFIISVIGANNKPVNGVQPLEIEIIDPKGKRNEFSGYFAAMNGVLKVNFIPAENDALGAWKVNVTDLSSGLKADKTFVF